MPESPSTRTPTTAIEEGCTTTSSGEHASADASRRPDAPSRTGTVGTTTKLDSSLLDSSLLDSSSPDSSMLDASKLETEIVGAAGLMATARHRLITALAAYDDSGAWALTGANTCSEWVADRLGIHSGTAREWLRVGHALQRLPLLDAGMASGRLSYCAVRSITRVAVDHPDHERELVELAELTPPRQLRKVLAAWAMGHDTDAGRDKRERRDTYFSSRVEPDGMGTIHIRLPAIDMGRIQAAVDARVMRSRPSDPDHRHPSLGFQRAEAVVELLTAPPGEGDSAGAVATEVVVHVRADGCSMHDGTPLADSTVASLLDGAFIRMLIHDAENRPVNASVRRRHPTIRQKRVVDERDPCCVDCGGTELLEYDHDPAYSVSGRTHTDELSRRCPRCHDRRHGTAAHGAHP